ncbi:MAG: phosphatase PAP2 family protein [Planctomycetaceae bacterium]|nr:phosphatase PAP2 family protein [Planctomycetaceae bacterium]
MNRITWIIAGCIGLAALVGCAIAGFAVDGLHRPMIVTAMLGLAIWHYRRVAPFRLCLSALALLVVFSVSFVVLTYLAARLSPSLVDGWLAGCDASLGFSTRCLVAWQLQHPILGTLLDAAYNSLLPQTAATVGILGLMGRAKPLDAFLRRMMLAALLVLACFLLLPAAGPCSAMPSPSQAHYLDHFLSLRSGLRTGMSLADAEGLITFPSFHTIWALLLVAACPVRLKPLSMLLNAAVIVATLTTGWHYLTDVLAGIVVFYLACWLVPATTRDVLPQVQEGSAVVPAGC